MSEDSRPSARLNRAPSTEQVGATDAFDAGRQYDESGDLPAAEEAYRTADEFGHVAAAVNLGLLLQERSDLTGAEQAFRRADERGDATAAFHLAWLLVESGDYAGAEKAYRRAALRGHPGARANLRVLLRGEDPPRGIIGANASSGAAPQKVPSQPELVPPERGVADPSALPIRSGTKTLSVGAATRNPVSASVDTDATITADVPVAVALDGSAASAPAAAAEEGSLTQRVGRRIANLQQDPLARTSFLLIADNLLLSALGGLCSVLAARLWPVPAVGLVAAVYGGVSLITSVTLLGMPTVVLRFVRKERRPRRLVAEATLVCMLLSSLTTVVVVALPAHLGLPLGGLGIGVPLAAAGLVVYQIATSVTQVGDPSYIARQEVSILMAKDVAASLARVVLILAFAGAGGPAALFGITIAYASIAAVIDLPLLWARLGKQKLEHLRDEPATEVIIPAEGVRPAGGAAAPLLQEVESRWRRPFGIVRSHTTFAAGSYIAALVSAVPTATLPALAAHLSGAKSAAYIAISLQVSSILTLLPAQTAQALLAELAHIDRDRFASVTLRALRGAYAVTLPAAAVVIIGAPYILHVFGRDYSEHGTAFLRWAAAGSVFFVFNYVGDVTLLAASRIRAYATVNTLGAIWTLAIVGAALSQSFDWLGPAWFAAQAMYAATSLVMLVRTFRPARASLSKFRRRLGGDRFG